MGNDYLRSLRHMDGEASPPCPCDTGQPLAACCGRFHQAWQQQDFAALPGDARTLMRSRYSAYVLDRTDYLLGTWHPDHRPAVLQANEPGLHWLGLRIVSYLPVDAAHAQVEFVARWKMAGRVHRLQERSRFVSLAGQWLYMDGDMR